MPVARLRLLPLLLLLATTPATRAAAEVLYATEFGPPLFASQQPIVGVDGWLAGWSQTGGFITYELVEPMGLLARGEQPAGPEPLRDRPPRRRAGRPADHAETPAAPGPAGAGSHLRRGLRGRPGRLRRAGRRRLVRRRGKRTARSA